MIVEIVLLWDTGFVTCAITVSIITIITKSRRKSSSTMLWLLKVSLLLAGITCTRRVIATALPNTDVQPKQAAAVAMADPIAKLLASADYLSPRVGGGGGQKENEIVMNPSEVGGEGNRNAFALWPSSIVPDEAEAGFEPALDDDLANEKRATWNSFQGLWCLQI